jgi:hypothetical protein
MLKTVVGKIRRAGRGGLESHDIRTGPLPGGTEGPDLSPRTRKGGGKIAGYKKVRFEPEKFEKERKQPPPQTLGDGE